MQGIWQDPGKPQRHTLKQNLGYFSAEQNFFSELTVEGKVYCEHHQSKIRETRVL